MTVFDMVREAVDTLGGETTNVAVRDWILEHHPGTNPNTIQNWITACTVNHNSRIHYAENSNPRRADSKYDFLFRPVRGLLERYDPGKHGEWEIFEWEDGRLGVRQVRTEIGEEEGTEVRSGTGFAAEDHLRDYLAKHLDLIEQGLELYVDDEGRNGVEYFIEVGKIDILAVDKDSGFVVIELKVSRGPDAVAGQVLRYKNWVKVNLAGNKLTRGIIVAGHVSDKILYAIASDPEVTAREYELSLSLREIPKP
jgi:hypothetical protein